MKRIIKPFNISEEGFLSHFDVETRSGYPVVIDIYTPYLLLFPKILLECIMKIY